MRTLRRWLRMALHPRQAYYWSKEWQLGTQEALRELERGEAVYFGSTNDAIRWLTDPKSRDEISPSKETP